MGNDMFNDEQLAHAKIVQKETEEALGWWKDRALKAEAERDALLSRPAPPADAATEDNESGVEGICRACDPLVCEEQSRWQKRIEEVISRAGLEPCDASGNESGDPLDYSADQIESALAHALHPEEADAATEAVRIITAERERDAAVARLNEAEELRPASEWHEDIGDVLWYPVPVEEPPYCGSPLDSDWPFDEDFSEETGAHLGLRKRYEGKTLMWQKLPPLAPQKGAPDV